MTDLVKGIARIYLRVSTEQQDLRRQEEIAQAIADALVKYRNMMENPKSVANTATPNAEN